MKARAGLVLTGGGARAAYQVGVVKAVRDILGNPVKNPFPILCGTSAGAINATTLAVFADDFSRGVANLLEVWENMHCHHVYRTDPGHILRSGARWLGAMMLLSRVPGIGPVGPWSTGGGLSSSTPVGVAQPGQNRACAGSSVPQFGQ